MTDETNDWKFSPLLGCLFLVVGPIAVAAILYFGLGPFGRAMSR